MVSIYVSHSCIISAASESGAAAHVAAPAPTSMRSAVIAEEQLGGVFGEVCTCGFNRQADGLSPSIERIRARQGDRELRLLALTERAVLPLVRLEGMAVVDNGVSPSPPITHAAVASN